MADATRQLLDRARRHLSFEDLCRFVGPSDPGWIESLGVMAAIWEDGEAALAEGLDWEPLLHAHRDRGAVNPRAYLWYRLLAVAASLLSNDDMLALSIPVSLGRLIGDAAALERLGAPDAPSDLVAEICAEVDCADADLQTEIPVVEDEAADVDFGGHAIAFFLQRAKSSRGRKVALRLAESCFYPGAATSDADLGAMNNAIHLAHACGAFERAARWADVARPHARKNANLPHNLACAFAAVGRMDDAFAMCAIAVEQGYDHLEAMRTDEDLGTLRSEPRFRALFR